MDTINNNLVEEVTCKKCGNVVYREVEQYKIYTENIKEDVKNLYAVFIKKFECPSCGEKNKITSRLVEKNEETQNIIKFDTVIEKAKKKKTRVKKKKEAIPV